MKTLAPSPRWLTLIVLVLICGLLAIPANGPFGPTRAEAAPPPTKSKNKPGIKKTAANSNANAKHHGHVKAAIAKLHAAKKDLAAAPVQHGGHREKALQDIDRALKQLRELERHLHKK